MSNQIDNSRSANINDNTNPDVLLRRLKKMMRFVRVWVTLATILMLLLLLINLRDAGRLPFDFLYTPTPTATPTFTPTPTSTSTFTLTPSPTLTYTITPSPTATFTLTPSLTLTDTPSPIPTETSTPTLSPTITATLTLTPRPTLTPSYTPTLTPEPIEYATLRWGVNLSSPDGLVRASFPAGEKVVILEKNEDSCLVRIYKEVKLGNDYISLTAWVEHDAVGQTCP
jgi:hypothetical protein